MVRWFTDWLARFVELGIQLAGALIRGVLRAPHPPSEAPSDAERVPPPSLEERAQEQDPPEG